MSPAITLYIKRADQKKWEIAKRFAERRGKSLSEIVTEALVKYVAGQEDSRTDEMNLFIVKSVNREIHAMLDREMQKFERRKRAERKRAVTRKRS